MSFLLSLLVPVLRRLNRWATTDERPVSSAAIYVNGRRIG